MDFFRFTLQLIDFLAWPVLALGYPICASIRAIETGSKYHMRKLVTYWTIFSVISLFELVFEKLIEWVPLWPYIKLITICWLVIPQFNGTCYFYQNLLHPCFPVKLHNVIARFFGSCYVYQRLQCLCLSVNLQTVTEWFNKPIEDPSLKSDMFLAVAERYLEENGSDALDKLIANKTGCEGVSPVWEDIKVLEHTTRREAAEAKQVKTVEENVVQIGNKTTGVQVKETAVPAVAEEIKLPEITSSKHVQTEWMCAVCQVTTTSEHHLKSHLNGRIHKATCEELKTCKQTAKSEENPPVATKKSNLVNQEQVKHAAAARLNHITSEAAEPKQVKSVKGTLIQIEEKTTVMQVKETAVPANAEDIKLPESSSSKKVQTEWTCAVCQVTTTSEHDLKCHLRGRRHWEKREELKNFKKAAKTERNISSTLTAPDQLSTRRKHNTNEKLKENVQVGATLRHKKQKQVKNAGGATQNSKLWCSFCNIRCPGKTDMAAHLNGKKHLVKLQETTSSINGGTWAFDYANMQFNQGM